MTTAKDAGHARKSAVLRRRPSPQQGRALEILGHAIDYLMDSYVLTASQSGGPGDAEAAQLLMRLNMEIFAECSEVVPFARRIQAWVKALGKARG